MQLSKGNTVQFGEAKIAIQGLLICGGGMPYNAGIGSGNLSIPRHQIPGVYAGRATHSLAGKKLSKDIAVIVLCNDKDNSIHVRSNNVLNKPMGSMNYADVKVLN